MFVLCLCRGLHTFKVQKQKMPKKMWLEHKKKSIVESSSTMMYAYVTSFHWWLFYVTQRLSLLQAAESRRTDFVFVPNTHIVFSLAHAGYQRDPHVHTVPEISNSTFSAICLCECVSAELTFKGNLHVWTMNLLRHLILKHMCAHCQSMGPLTLSTQQICHCKHFKIKT